MTTANETYVYSGPCGIAALHLLDHSALADCTTREDTVWAGADAIRVRKAWPMLSRGEELLWAALDSLTRGSGDVDLGQCAEVLDAANLRVLHEALGLAFGVKAVAS